MDSKHIDIIVEAAKEFEKLAEGNPEAKVRNRGDCVFSASHPKVTDNKDHFPVNNEGQAHSALSYANGFSAAPPWYSGSLSSLVNAVARKVHSKYPGIQLSDKSKNPGKD